MVTAHNISITSPKTAEKVTNNDRPVMILYHASWCGHCTQFKPTWEVIKTSLSKDKGIVMADVLYDNMKNLPSTLQDVMGFPTIRILKHGKVVSEYNGQRTSEDIISYAKIHAMRSAPSRLVTTPKTPVPASKTKTKAKAKAKATTTTTRRKSI